MANIDDYLRVSGSPDGTSQLYRDLRSQIPDLGKNPEQAAIRLKKALFNGIGFQYGALSFTAHDVLGTKNANCLGIPLLMGSLLEDLGFNTRYQIGVRPLDAVHTLEQRFYDRLQEEVDYDNPKLNFEQEQFPVYRFTPLEHLVIDLGDGKLLETTSEEDSGFDFESLRPVSFRQALSGVLKDRAVREMGKNNFKHAKKLAKRGLEYWSENRQLHQLLATIASAEFDDKTYQRNLDRFKSFDDDDSLFNLNLGVMQSNRGLVEKVLDVYPACAGALIAKAYLVEEDDKREARHLLAMASHLYGNSNVLSLPLFYIGNAEILGRLFDKEEVASFLESYGNSYIGDFDYHLALYDVTGDTSQLGEMEEAIEIPYQELVFLQKAVGNEFEDRVRFEELDRKYEGSELYRKAKDLKDFPASLY